VDEREKKRGINEIRRDWLLFHTRMSASAKTAITSPTGIRASTMFTDSAIYRVRCKEADTIAKLAVIPRECTLRDQRVEIR
jgi:hypothetical protein